MITFKKSEGKENPFYGADGLLNLFQQASKMGSNPNKSTLFTYLNNAYKELDTDEKKELFYVIVFSLGDISNREHNLFKKAGIKKVDNGGNSLRKLFIYALEWMLTNSEETRNQFYKFLPILADYTSFESLFMYQLKTDRFKGGVQEVIKLPIDIDKVTDYLSQIISSAKTPDITHGLIAKFIPRDSNIKPRKRVKVVPASRKEFTSKKLGKVVKPGDTFTVKSKIQAQTAEREKFRYQFLLSLSKKLNWEVVHYKNNARFRGVEAYKAKYNRLTEAYLFSSKEILNLDKDQFITWLNTLPSGARFRVQRRILDKDKNGKTFKPNGKWINKFGNDLGTLFQTWEKGKVAAQEVLLNLTEAEKKEMAPSELKKYEKAAKVTTGADTLLSAIAKVKMGTLSDAEAKLVSQSILDKIKLEAPVFVFGDVSGSMTGFGMNIGGVDFQRLDIVSIVATAFLMKNPMPELKSLMGVWSTDMDILTDYNYKIANKRNRYMYNEAPRIGDKLLVDPTKPFVDNWKNIDSILRTYDFCSTNIEAISRRLKQWVDSEPDLKEERIEQIAKYQIHVYISDGDFNGSGNATSSILNHRNNMKQWFGWDGIMVIWDVKNESSRDGDKFKGVPNTMYFGNNNSGTLNTVLSNITDLDIVDVYLPLKALYASNRYAPVKDLVDKKVTMKSKSKKDLVK